MRPVLVLASLLLHTAALAAEPAAPEGTAGLQAPLVTRDYLVASSDPGILLSVRYKAASEDLRRFGPGDVIVLVHGATLSSRPAFDPPVADASLATWLARRGHAVYLMDVRNYGGSTRDRVMDEPPDRNPAPSRSHEAIRDIATVVEHVLARHGLSQVDLLGWSWGGMTVGHYASLNPKKVRKLVLFAPIYSGREPPEPYEPSGAYGLLPATGPALKGGWSRSLDPAWGAAPWEDAVVDAVAREVKASDPMSGVREPPAARFPKGSFEDLHIAREGRPFWNASTIASDTLVVRGDRDLVAPAEHAEALMRDLTHARSRRSVTIAGGTHFLQFEPRRSELFEVVRAFLATP